MLANGRSGGIPAWLRCRNVSIPCARGVPVGAETSVSEGEWQKVVTIRLRRFPRCAANWKRGNEGGVADLP